MSRYIDVDKLQETVYKRVNNPAIRGWLNSLINEQPTADIKEVKHGEWVHGECVSHCSECGVETYPENITPYCPNCGAKMDGGDNE